MSIATLVYSISSQHYLTFLICLFTLDELKELYDESGQFRPNFGAFLQADSYAKMQIFSATQ